MYLLFRKRSRSETVLLASLNMLHFGFLKELAKYLGADFHLVQCSFDFKGTEKKLVPCSTAII